MAPRHNSWTLIIDPACELFLTFSGAPRSTPELSSPSHKLFRLSGISCQIIFSIEDFLAINHAEPPLSSIFNVLTF